MRLDKEERAVLRRETGTRYRLPLRLILIAALIAGVVSMVVFHAPHVVAGGKFGAFIDAPFLIIFGFPGYAPFVALFFLLKYLRARPLKKRLGFDPRKQNRAAGVIYCFDELRLTRAQLITGYGTDALRFPLRGLVASVQNTGATAGGNDDRRVHVTIKGPDANFVYSKAATTDSIDKDARQLAALLNYEASIVRAPLKKAQHTPQTEPSASEADA